MAPRTAHVSVVVLWLLLNTLAERTHGQVKWKDCAADPLTAAITFDSFRVWPVPVMVPGEVHFSADITVNTPIHRLYIDEDVERELITHREHRIISALFNVPCLGDEFGSCNKINTCEYQVVDMPELVDKFMFYLLGNTSSCPIQSKSIRIQDEVISLPRLPQLIESMANSNYTVKFLMKDDPSSSTAIGCIQFVFSFAVANATQGHVPFVGR